MESHRIATIILVLLAVAANVFTLAAKVLQYLNNKDYENKLGQTNVV